MTTNVAALAVAHLRISLLAVALGTLVAAPLALWAVGRPRVERTVLAVASIVQTIPGLALLAAMVPALAALGAVLHARVPAIGELPAVLALSIYAVLPVLRGSVLGITTVDPAAIEAADAVGMTRAQRLLKVEIPLALPHVMGGLRTATVWTVGTATLATPVGATSLGELIFGGLQTRRYHDVLVGCVASAVLAVGLDALLRLAESRASSRRGRTAALVTLGVLVSWAVVDTVVRAVASDVAAVRIGAKPFTEQRVLAAELARTVERAGARADVKTSLGTTIAFDALVHGELDLYVEYVGTVWTTMMGRSDMPRDGDLVGREVEAWLKSKGVEVAARLGFENAYALVVRADTPYRAVSDLGAGEALSLAADYEFLSRPEWASMQAAYGVRFRSRRPMDPSLLYQAVATGAVDVATGYTTDARIETLHLRALTDDRHAIPPYDALVLASSAFLVAHPSLARALRALDGTIDDAKMRAASALVDRDGQSSEAAAKWLDGESAAGGRR
jgi:osmoprotectant transport system permease protein